jgi:plasmid maintenance system antidote protein VapI
LHKESARRSVTAVTALRWARYFGGDAQSWLNLQTAFDLRTAEPATGSTLLHDIQPRAA